MPGSGCGREAGERYCARVCGGDGVAIRKLYMDRSCGRLTMGDGGRGLEVMVGSAAIKKC